MTSKPIVKAGDLVVLRRGQSGSASGFYLVREVLSSDDLWVIPVDGGTSFPVPIADVVWLGANAHSTAEMTLDPRPTPTLPMVPPEPPAPQELRLFRLVRPRPDYRFDHPVPGRGKVTTNHYVVSRDAIETGVDGIGQRFVDLVMEGREGAALRAEWGDEAVQDRGPWPSPRAGAA